MALWLHFPHFPLRHLLQEVLENLVYVIVVFGGHIEVVHVVFLRKLASFILRDPSIRLEIALVSDQDHLDTRLAEL